MSNADTLFISDNFFGYATEIAAELEARGRRVLWFPDRPLTDTMSKVLTRLHPRLVSHRADDYFDTILEATRTNAIDQVLVIKGESISAEFVARLRQALPHARFTLYFWDSFRNMPRSSVQKVDLFDRVLSFDQRDVSADPRLIYRPLFYVKHMVDLPVAEPDIDYFFIGTAHTDRYSILKSVEKRLRTRDRHKWVLYYPSYGLFVVRRLLDPRLWGSDLDEFVFSPVSRADVRLLLARSRVVVDIERKIQSGFTMRTIEMLGAKRKLLTTNANARSADFFRSGNISVIERGSLAIDQSFIDTPYEDLPPDLMDRYSLSGWIDDIMPAAKAPTADEAHDRHSAVQHHP